MIKIPLLLRSGLRHQLTHRWQTLLALSGIIMGVAIVLAVDLANSAAKASFLLSAEQLRGSATHRLQGQIDDIPQSLYQSLFTSSGHPPMAPVVKLDVQTPDQQQSYRLLGIDIFAEKQFRPQLSSPISNNHGLVEWLTNPKASIISRDMAQHFGLKPGDKFDISYRGRSYTLKVFAINNELPAATSDLLVVDIATAQAISGDKHGLSQIDLILDKQSESWIKARIPDTVQLIDISQQTSGVLRLSQAFELNLTAMSLLALMVGLFLIFNAMSFSIVQRRNLFGRLRALGVMKKELYRLLLSEALVLGMLGSTIGVVLGQWLGKELTGIVAQTVSELYYRVSADAMQLSSLSLLKAFTLGIGGTLVATWIPAYLASRIPPLTTLSRAALEYSSKHLLPRLALTGLLLLGSGLFIAFRFPGGVLASFVGLFICLLGFALVTPFGLLLTQWLLTRLPLSGITRMATRDMDRHLSRLSTAAAALMVALAATVGVSIMVNSMRSSVSDWLKDLLNADVYIAAKGFQQGAVMDPAVIQQLRLLDKVTDISLYRNQTINLHNRAVKLVGSHLSLPSRNGYQILSGDPVRAWQQYDQGSIFISEPLANRLQLKPGDQLQLPTQQGKHQFNIAAVVRDYSSEHGRVYLQLNYYRKFWNDQHINTLAVFSSSMSAQALMQFLQHEFRDRDDLEFTAARAIYDESMNVFARTFRITEVLRLLAIAVAFIGILTALMAIQLERRKEFAVLRALGLTRSQISQLIVIESLLLGLVSALMAIPAGLAMAWVLTDAIQLRAFSWTMPLQIAADPLWLTLFLGLGAAALASLYPAWHASRSSPAGQLRED